MKNPNGPSREDVECWHQELEDREGERRSSAARCSPAQRREITCPNCKAKIVDNGKRDEITQDWIAECVCGWWRSIVLPISRSKCAGERPDQRPPKMNAPLETETIDGGSLQPVVTRPLLRYHGGKWQLAPWINSLMPRHRIYVEPFGGGGSVLLQKSRSYAEIYNDLDGEIVNLFRVVRDNGEALKRVVELTPFARAEFELSVEPAEDPVEQARRTLVRSYMGFGGNLTRLTVSGRLEHTGFRNYSKKNRRSTPAQDWHHWPAGLPELIARLQGVIIERRDACEVMLKHDGPDTLHFVDPPYVHETRERTNSYRHEMDEEAHRRLAGVLNELQGGVILAGYGCPLYDDELYVGWKRITRKAFADGARERTEVLWLRNVEADGMLPGLDG